jgi:hypothetical protein
MNDLPEYLPPTFDACLTLALQRYECRLCAAVSTDPAGVLPLLDKVQYRPEVDLQAVKFFKAVDANIEIITSAGEDEARATIHQLIWDNDLFYDWAGWQIDFEPGVPWVDQAARWLYNARALRAARLGLRVLQSDPGLLQEVYNDRS